MNTNIFNRVDVIELLKKSLKDTKYLNKNCPLKINGETIPDDYYGIYFVIDALIKYEIIISDREYLDEYVLKLKRLTKKVTRHNDLIFGVNKVLGQIVAKKLNIKEQDTEEAKKEILEYIYNKYIVNGYMYHAIPNVYAKTIKENGIEIGNYNHSKELYEKANNIFKTHNIELLGDYLFNMTYITLTDSAFMGAFYSYNSPVYFSNLLTKSKYLTSKKVVSDAYIKKDYEACKNNLTLICEEHLSNKEKEIVNEYFESEWNTLVNSNNSICLIKRKAIGRDFLKDYKDILSTSKNKNLTTSIMKITESRLAKEKCFNNINPTYINIIDIPSIKDILDEEVIEQLDLEETETKEEQIDFKLANNYGMANFFVLGGLLLITLGVTLTIMTIGG